MECVQVRLRENGKIFAYNSNNIKTEPGDCVILEADRGLDYGQVISEQEDIAEESKDTKKILRRANRTDMAKIYRNRQKVKKALSICVKKIKYHNLDMKLVNAEYSFDRSKIIFYFTSEGRVDFRDLVKELAQIFKLRIELRQIGARDEAKMTGGIGPCGRSLCCSAYMKNFEPVNIRMAKQQDMPLTPSKVSGLCGRLMCCLGYEYKVYKQLSKKLPSRGDTIEVDQGKAKVVEVNILEKTVRAELEDGKQIDVSYSK